MIKKVLEEYQKSLVLSEKSKKTIKTYTTILNEFIKVEEIEKVEDITKEKLIDYKDYIQEKYKVNTVNIKITILNNFISFIGLDNSYRLKHLKKQQATTLENVLSQTDYERLLRTAQKKKKIKMYYLMKTLAETGIRISELQYITVEAVKKGVAIFNSKGTVERTAFINKKLKKELLQYCKEKNITSGAIFKSNQGNVLDNTYVYKQIQELARTSKNKEK